MMTNQLGYISKKLMETLFLKYGIVSKTFINSKKASIRTVRKQNVF